MPHREVEEVATADVAATPSSSNTEVQTALQTLLSPVAMDMAALLRWMEERRAEDEDRRRRDEDRRRQEDEEHRRQEEERRHLDDECRMELEQRRAEEEAERFRDLITQLCAQRRLPSSPKP